MRDATFMIFFDSIIFRAYPFYQIGRKTEPMRMKIIK